MRSSVVSCEPEAIRIDAVAPLWHCLLPKVGVPREIRLEYSEYEILSQTGDKADTVIGEK
jgi:hypothetical protein